MAKPVLMLVNRSARSGRCDLTAPKQVLLDAGLEVVEKTAPRAGDVSDVIRQHRVHVSAVIIGGGDGTLNAAAAGLHDTHLPLGILPLGTANDLARTLGIAPDPLTAAGIIAAGHQRRIDLGIVNDRYFFNAASLGLSVRITRRLNSGMKSRWGVLAYALAAVRVLFGARRFRVDIEHGGETIRVKTSQIVVGNGHYFGGGLVTSAAAQIDDGRLYLSSLELRRWWHLFLLLPKLLRGTLGESPHARVLTGSEFRITPARRPREINTDGEITTRTPGHFRILPRAIAVFAPPVSGE